MFWLAFATIVSACYALSETYTGTTKASDKGFAFVHSLPTYEESTDVVVTMTLTMGSNDGHNGCHVGTVLPSQWLELPPNTSVDDLIPHVDHASNATFSCALGVCTSEVGFSLANDDNELYLLVWCKPAGNDGKLLGEVGYSVNLSCGTVGVCPSFQCKTEGEICNNNNDELCNYPDLQCDSVVVGTCEKTSSVGGQCASNSECLVGECDSGTCVIRKKVGDACTSDLECLYGARKCGPVTKTCSGSADDSVCLDDFDCNVGSGCTMNITSNQLACQPRLPSGTPCRVDAQDESMGNCVLGSRCNAFTLICTELYSLDEGSSSPRDELCRSGYLDPSTRQCAALPTPTKPGEACESDSDCPTTNEHVLSVCSCGIASERKCVSEREQNHGNALWERSYALEKCALLHSCSLKVGQAYLKDGYSDCITAHCQPEVCGVFNELLDGYYTSTPCIDAQDVGKLAGNFECARPPTPVPTSSAPTTLAPTSLAPTAPTTPTARTAAPTASPTTAPTTVSPTASPTAKAAPVKKTDIHLPLILGLSAAALILGGFVIYWKCLRRTYKRKSHLLQSDDYI